MSDRPPELYGIPISELARICRVSIKTARRWKRGQTVPPESALMLLRGDLGCMADDWAGWSIRKDRLYSPEGWEVTRQDVLASPLLRAQLAAYQTENKSLKAKLDNWEEQPLPGDIPEIRSIFA